jgi:hypothetical protein
MNANKRHTTKIAAALTAVVIFGTTAAQALVLHQNTGLTADVAASVGKIGSGTGIYLGNGQALTAAHIGAGDILIDGVTLPAVPGTARQLTNFDGSSTDLVVFQVNTAGKNVADLGVTLSSEPIAQGDEVLLVGFGVGQNAAPLVGFDGSAFGYSWNSERTQRQGTATVSTAANFVTLGSTQTPVFSTTFNNEDSTTQATTGDSGGAAFRLNAASGEYELAGVMVGITGRQGVSRFGSDTHIADLNKISELARFDSELPTTGAVPEPSTALYAAIALCLAFFRRRR